MGFKKLKDYNTQRFGSMFLLRDDRDYADVIFLYQSYDDVLVANAHYIKSNDYSGYVHCCGAGCPACSKGIRIQTKLFIPLYNITEGEIQFWDRNSSSFEAQLNKDVLSRFSNPSEIVFRITRHGVPRDVNTTYQITALGKNNDYPYGKILQDCHATFPDHYSKVCKEYSILELDTLLNSTGPRRQDDYDIPDYSITPRSSFHSDVSGVDSYNPPSSFESEISMNPFDSPEYDIEDLPDYHVESISTSEESVGTLLEDSEEDEDVDDVDF